MLPDSNTYANVGSWSSHNCNTVFQLNQHALGWLSNRKLLRLGNMNKRSIFDTQTLAFHIPLPIMKKSLLFIYNPHSWVKHVKVSPTNNNCKSTLPTGYHGFMYDQPLAMSEYCMTPHSSSKCEDPIQASIPSLYVQRCSLYSLECYTALIRPVTVRQAYNY